MNKTVNQRRKSAEFIDDIYSGNAYSSHIKAGQLGNLWQSL